MTELAEIRVQRDLPAVSNSPGTGAWVYGPRSSALAALDGPSEQVHLSPLVTKEHLDMDVGDNLEGVYSSQRPLTYGTGIGSGAAMQADVRPSLFRLFFSRRFLLPFSLVVVGVLVLLTGLSLATGSAGAEHQPRGVALAALGALMFIPGAYAVRVAYMAMRGNSAYTLAQIPTF